MKHSFPISVAIVALLGTGADFAAETPMKSVAPAAPAAGTPFARLDINQDGRLSREEVSSSADLTSRFDALDGDRNAYISQLEYAKWEESSRMSSSPAAKPGAEKKAPTGK
jgi:hypothetical protein